MPAGLVAQALMSLQLTMYQLGEHLLGRGAKGAGAYSAEVTERCRLEIGATRTGSYHAELVLAEPKQVPLFSESRADDLGFQALTILETSLRALVIQDHAGFIQGLRDATVRRRVLQYLAGMLPRTGEPFRVDLSISGGEVIRLGPELRRVITAWSAERPQHETVVEGQLVELQIVPRLHFKVLCADDERLVEADFNPGLEPSLISWMGQTVRVRGTAELGPGGRLQRLVDVSSVEPIMVEYLPVHKVDSDRVHLRFVRPLLALKTIEDGLVVIRIPELGLHEFGETVKEAVQAMEEELVFLWEEYALADPDGLTEDAIRLRERLREIAVQVDE